MRPLASANLLAHISLAGRRTFATSRPSIVASRARGAPRPTFYKTALRQSIRRASTEDVVKPETVAKAKHGGFGILRWTWRLTYLSALGGIAYLGYGIYIMRHPADQPNPDPSKKTLVILGMELPLHPILLWLTQLTADRNWMGRRFAA